MANELELSAGVRVLNPVPLDPYYGPYLSISAACAAVPAPVRAKGIRKVGILQGDGSVLDYWWPNSQADAGLVPYTPDLSGKADKKYVDDQDSAIVDGAPAAGNTLGKLYLLIQGLFNQKVFATDAERDAYNVPALPFQAFVTNDGDGKWAIYQAISTGVNATYVKISDPDLLNAAQTAAQIKTAYESNPDTNAFTDALKAALVAIVNNGYVDLKNAQNNIAGDKSWLGKQTMPYSAARRIALTGGTPGGTASNTLVYDSSYFRYAPTAAGQTITSFTSGDSGQLLFIANDGPGNLTLKNSLALTMPNGVDFVIPPGGGAVLIGGITGGSSSFSVLAVGSNIAIASVADLVAGTDNTKMITPQTLINYLLNNSVRFAGVEFPTTGLDQRGIRWDVNTDYSKQFFYSTGDGQSQMIHIVGDNGTPQFGADNGWVFVKDVLPEDSMPDGTAVGNTTVQPLYGGDKRIKVFEVNMLALNWMGWKVWHAGNIADLKSALGNIGGPANTDGLTEGLVNLYYKDSRAIAAPLTGLVTTSAAPVTQSDTPVTAAGKLQAQLNAVNLIKGYTLSFTAPVFEYKEYYEKAASIVSIIGDPGVSTLKYSTNDGVSYTTLALPYSTSFVIPDGTWVRWRITFATNKTLASVFIKFQ